MKIQQAEPSKNSHLVLTNIDQRLYVEAAGGQRVWVATNYGEIQIGVGGKTYRVVEGELVESKEAVAVYNPYC